LVHSNDAIVQQPGPQIDARDPAVRVHGSVGQVGGAHLLVRGRFGHGTLVADMAFLDDIRAIGDEFDEMQVLFVRQYAQAFLFQFQNSVWRRQVRAQVGEPIWCKSGHRQSTPARFRLRPHVDAKAVHALRSIDNGKALT